MLKPICRWMEEKVKKKLGNLVDIRLFIFFLTHFSNNKKRVNIPKKIPLAIFVRSNSTI